MKARLSAAVDYLIIWSVWAAWWILKPFVTIRIGSLYYDRIGHLIANTEYWLRRKEQDPPTGDQHIFFSGDPANRQLLTMIKRRFRVWDGRRSLKVYRALKRRIPPGPFWDELHKIFWGPGTWTLWDKSRPQLSFVDDEHRRGRELLRAMGIRPGEPYVCFHARDKEYLRRTHPYQFPEAGWKHHDYRDCDINNYLQAAEKMAESGIWALRMGSVVEKPLARTRERVVDYATRFRSDFGDIYLLAHCKFFIANTAGPFLVSTAFHVPVVWTNVAPLGQAAYRSCDLFIPMKYWHIQEERVLTFPESVEIGADLWCWTELFEKAGLRTVENTPEDILDVATEMNARLDGTWTPDAGDEELQNRFRSLFPPGHPMTGYVSRVGAEFLRKNRRLLDRASP